MDKGKHGFDGQKCAHASSKLRGNRNGPDLPLRQSMNQEAGGEKSITAHQNSSKSFDFEEFCFLSCCFWIPLFPDPNAAPMG